MTIFHPPFSLYPYQADLAAKTYYNHSTILAASTGMGKTVITLAAACMSLEDNKIDFLMVGCESGKVGEWEDDIALFTDISAVRYAGSPKQREKIRQRIVDGEVSCIIGVYETFRNDLLGRKSTGKNKRGYSLVDGPLLEALKPFRVLYIKDEGPSKMGASRDSGMYKAHERLVQSLPNIRFIEVSATPVDRDPEGYYNIGRLLTPLGTVKSFYEDHVAAFDFYKKPSMFKNLDEGMSAPGVVPLKEKMNGVLLVKSKKDPDVAHLFPKEVPNYTYVTFSDNERDFYKWIIKEYSNQPDSEGGVYVALRQFCAHPLALAHSPGGIATDIVSKASRKTLEALDASKCERVVSRLKTILSQGERVVVFTFFGQSVIPIYHQRFIDEGWSVSVNHGSLSVDQKDKARKEFRSGETQIFLSSDAGARGINLPEACYVEEVDFPLKWSTHVQRISRVSRVDSVNSTIWWNGWSVKDTIEEQVLQSMIARKGYADNLVFADSVSNEALHDMLKKEREKI